MFYPIETVEAHIVRPRALRQQPIHSGDKTHFPKAMATPHNSRLAA